MVGNQYANEPMQTQRATVESGLNYHQNLLDEAEKLACILADRIGGTQPKAASPDGPKAMPNTPNLFDTTAAHNRQLDRVLIDLRRALDSLGG